MLSIAESSLADVSLEDTDKPGFRRFIRRTPLGVVFVIAPWKWVNIVKLHMDVSYHTSATRISRRSTRFCQQSLQATQCC